MRQKINPDIRDATEIERLRKDFEYFDRNEDGLMEFTEFVRFLRAIGAHLPYAEYRSGFSEIDTDRDGVIEFEEFLDWWRS